MRLLYKLILSDPDFLYKLKKWCVQRNMDNKKMWYFIKALKDHSTDEVPIINFLYRNNLISKETYEILMREVREIEEKRGR